MMTGEIEKDDGLGYRYIPEEYIRRIPPSVPPGSKRAFSNYILPFSSLKVHKSFQ
jgi:hypothetical protein